MPLSQIIQQKNIFLCEEVLQIIKLHLPELCGKPFRWSNSVDAIKPPKLNRGKFCDCHLDLAKMILSIENRDNESSVLSVASFWSKMWRQLIIKYAKTV